MVPIDLSGRTAIVTGSARRNGRAIALALAEAGAAVVVNARTSEEAASGVAQEIRQRGGRAIVCMADVTDPAAVQRLVDAAVAAFGGLDILVNNAAIKPHAALADLDLQQWRAVTAIMLDAAFLCAARAAPHLARSGHGRIVNIGGLHGHTGAKGRAHLVTGKAGIVGLTKALALDLAPQATVNCVVPGRMEDAFDSPGELAEGRRRFPPASIPLGKAGMTTDTAAAVLFFCSDLAGYITGQALHVNGGVYLG